VPQGPAGEEWDDEYDGVLELEAPWGGPRADGISLACKDSIVKDNVSHLRCEPVLAYLADRI
jgi:hypothetical protein